MAKSSLSSSHMPAPLVVNFVSDVATPHINALLRATSEQPGVQLRAWYAQEHMEKYRWERTHAHDVVPASIFGARWPSRALLRYAAISRGELFVVVGWSNPTTRLLLPLLAGLRRKFAFFTDHPEPRAPGYPMRKALRQAYLQIIRRGTVLAVGRNAVDYFVRRGFDPARVRNVPIPVTTPSNVESLHAGREQVRSALGVGAGSILFASGSRLVRAKGYDLVIAALSELSASDRERVRFLLVGDGPELPALRAQAAAAGLGEVVTFRPWMEPAEFEKHMCAADVILHPARFDAYGAPSLMAAGLGIAVVGSTGAGSAVELVEHGVTGFLYEPEDVNALSGYMRHFIEAPREASLMGLRQRDVARRCSPESMAALFVTTLRETARA